MAQMIFKVLAPASMPDAVVGIRPDPISVYPGGTKMPNNSVPVNFGSAVITGGTKVGKKWLGCTYMRPPFVIPGFGEIEEI